MLNSILSKKNILVIIFLCAIQFFTIKVFPQSFLSAIELVGGVIILFFLLLYMVYFRPETEVKKTFAFQVNLLIFALIMSIPMAEIFHNQSVPVTLFALKFTYFVFIYYLLHNLKISYEELERIIFFFGFAWTLIFLAQWAIYPTRIISARVEASRGTVRIFFPGSFFAMLAYFITLQRTLTQKFAFLNLAYLLLFFSAGAVLQGTRQALVTLTGFTGLFILLNRQIKSKGLIIFIGMIVGVSGFFIFYDIIYGMLSVTESQMVKAEDPIRIRAARFFTGEFMQHPLNYIFGNGADHGSSSFGKKIIYYKFVYGFFQSDIGIIGDYSKFGAFYLLAELLIYLKIFLGKIPKSLNVLKYFTAVMMLTMFTGQSVFGYAGGLTGIMVMLYMIDVEKYNQKKMKESTTESSESSAKR